MEEVFGPMPSTFIVCILILSIAGLCAALAWYAIRTRRRSEETAPEPGQPTEFPAAPPTKPQEQTTRTLDPVVQHGKAESPPTIADKPKGADGDSRPNESSSETGEPLAEDVQTAPGLSTTFATSESGPSTLAQPVQLSTEFGGPYSAESDNPTEGREIAVSVSGKPASVTPYAGEPLSIADEPEVAREQGQILRDEPNGTNSAHRHEGVPETVIATNNLRTGEIGPPSCLISTAVEGFENSVVEDGNFGGPTGSNSSAGAATATQLAPIRTIAVPQVKPKEGPKYQGLRAAQSDLRRTGLKPPTAATSPGQPSQLHLRVHTVLDRRGAGLRSLTLIPEWHPGIPENFEVTSIQGDIPLSRLEERCEDVVLGDIGTALREGVVWHGKGLAHCWRWVLSGRDLYVLARGDDAGLCGYVSVPRLLLAGEHVVLSSIQRRAEVLVALAQAGCGDPEIMDESIGGAPPGWLLLRSVKPTRAVQAGEDGDFLNALRPVAEIDAHFVGGIRLAGRTWLFGHPPRICFTGDIGGGFEVRIDGQLATSSLDGNYTASGWDSEGRHSLWFAGRLRKYLLISSADRWDPWSAHDFRTGAEICGPCTLPQNQALCHQVRVYPHNPVVIGSIPGQIFRCKPRADFRSVASLSFVPFAPVWALPENPLHADKRTARVVQVGNLRSVQAIPRKIRGRKSDPAIGAWCLAIRDAGRKGLRLETEEKDTAAYWREYRQTAKQLWRKMG